jgi:hypothetical protein
MPMKEDERVVDAFGHEVHYQACIAVLASAQVINILKGGHLHAHDHDRRAAATDYVWWNLQSFVLASANITKLLWGENPPKLNEPASRRRAKLRDELGVDHYSSLKPPLDFRNHLEHFDSRIEQWASSPGKGILLDRTIAPTDADLVSVSGRDGVQPAPASSHLRSFDPDRGLLAFPQETQSLGPQIIEIRNLCRKTDHLRWTMRKAPPRSPTPAWIAEQLEEEADSTLPHLREAMSCSVPNGWLATPQRAPA